MLKNITPLCVLATVLGLSFPAFAQSADACGFSYIILLDGNCMNMTYTSILGASRRNVSQANAVYQELFNANLELEIIYSQYPLLDNETEEERDARIENLVLTGMVRDEVVVQGQSIEDQLYPLHVQSMYIIGESFR
jgi:hypothetical protein